MLWESDLPISQVKRYSRQIILPKVKIEGQKALLNASVLVVGMGGLGSPVLMYLATTGIQRIGIVDFDKVELHNLQRQVIHQESTIGEYKTKSAKNFMNNLNSTIEIQEYCTVLDENNVFEIIDRYDIIVDCCDSLKLRYVLNDACRIKDKSLVCASVLRWEGQICVISPNNACYRCMFPEMKTSAPSCESSGVMGPVCGVIGSLQATEVVKLILSTKQQDNQNEDKTGILHIFNCFTNSFKVLEKKYKSCSVCRTKQMGEIKSMEKCPTGMKTQAPSLPWDYIMSNIQNLTIVDIRDHDQFGMFRVAGSFNIPEVEKNLEFIKSLKKPIVVSCYKGRSSNLAAKYLEDQGLKAFSADRGIEGFKEFIGFENLGK